MAGDDLAKLTAMLRAIIREDQPDRRADLVQQLAVSPALLGSISAIDVRLQIEARECRLEASRPE